MQGTVDHQLIFTDVYVGWPGCVTDARVWRNSPLNKMLQTGEGVLAGGVLIGDAAYPISSYLIPPFKETFQFEHMHLRFNKRLSGTRMAVERAFGRLKKKFPCLDGMEHQDVSTYCAVATACAILHNFIILRGQPLEEEAAGEIPVVHSDVFNEATTGPQKRACIMAHLMQNNNV